MFCLTELKDKIAVILQRSADTAYKTEIETWINLSLLTLHNRYDFFDELRGTFNFTTIDGTAVYYMPSDFDKPFRFYDITHNKPITIITEEEYFDGNIANIADAIEADAEYAYFIEVVGVKKQVATSGATVKAKSSSASDTSIIVRVEGFIDSNLTIIAFENITVTGTTATMATSPLTFYKILNVSKATDSIGYITLQDSSDNNLSIMGQIDRIIRHKVFRLGRIPDDSTTNMRVLYKKKFRKLVNAYDYPFIEADDFIIYNSASLGLQQSKETMDRATMMQTMANTALNLILLNQQNKLGPNYQHKITSPVLQAHRS